MKDYYVYKHTTPSGKVYIGITSQTPSRRWAKGFGYKTQLRFFRAIMKYGWDNIKHEVLYEGLTKEEAEAKEIELISLHRSSNNKYGYNIENGGKSVGRLSEETKRKISKAQKVIWTAELREVARKNNLGKRQSEETKKKRSNSLKGRFVSEETREKLRIKSTGKCVGAKSPRAKKIDMYSLEGEYIKTFGSSTEAAKEVQICYSNIIKCCTNVYKSAGGYLWKYHIDLEKEG